MKKLSLLLLSVLGFFMFTSCSEDNLGPVVNSNPGSPSITAPESGQSYTLSEDQAEDTLMTMEWTNPDYGFPSAPKYIIQMDSATQGFDDPMQLVTVNGTTYSIMVGQMNSTILGAGLPFGEEVSLEFRVIASLSDSMEQQISEPITLNFTAYSICKFCPAIYVPGSYQSASGYGSDWTPADAPALSTVNDQDQYEGYVYMANPDNQFKFTPERNWSLDFGDDGGDGTLEEKSANIALADAGYYKINVDLNSLTYSALNTTWGLIGDATPGGWNSDTDMTYDLTTKVWSLTVDLNAGSIKFRANDAWDLNYGDDGADGILERDGANISVSTAGNYTVKLNLSTYPYSYSITQN